MLNKRGNTFIGILIIILLGFILYSGLSYGKNLVNATQYRGTFIHKVQGMTGIMEKMSYVVIFPDSTAFYTETIEIAKVLVDEEIIIRRLKSEGKKE